MKKETLYLQLIGGGFCRSQRTNERTPPAGPATFRPLAAADGRQEEAVVADRFVWPCLPHAEPEQREQAQRSDRQRQRRGQPPAMRRLAPVDPSCEVVGGAVGVGDGDLIREKAETKRTLLI